MQDVWLTTTAHIATDLYWFFQERPVSSATNSDIITEWLLLLLLQLDIPTPPGVTWTGHSLRRGAACASHAIGVSFAVIMAWGLWKSLVSPFLYIDVSVRPSSEVLFFGRDAFEALLEFDDWRHRSPLGQLRVVLINNCIGNFDLTSAIRDLSSKVEMQITSCIQRF